MVAAGEGQALMPALVATALGEASSPGHGPLAPDVVGREIARAFRRGDPQPAHLAAPLRRIAPAPPKAVG